jgi:hypothetical protein
MSPTLVHMLRDITSCRRGDLNPHVPRRTLGPQPRFAQYPNLRLIALALVSGRIRGTGSDRDLPWLSAATGTQGGHRDVPIPRPSAQAPPLSRRSPTPNSILGLFGVAEGEL